MSSPLVDSSYHGEGYSECQPCGSSDGGRATPVSRCVTEIGGPGSRLFAEGSRFGTGQMPRNRRDCHPGFENESRLYGEGCLVVKDLAPEPGDHELGNHDVNKYSGFGV